MVEVQKFIIDPSLERCKVCSFLQYLGHQYEPDMLGTPIVCRGYLLPTLGGRMNLFINSQTHIEAAEIFL